MPQRRKFTSRECTIALILAVVWVGPARPGIETQWLPRSISFARPNGSFLWKKSRQPRRSQITVLQVAPAKKSSKRQLLWAGKETLDAVDLRPGIIRENITTEGINVNGLGLGEQLRIGPVLLQVSAVCTPCDQLEKVRPGLRREIYGRRGMLRQVLRGGTIRAGDAIARVAAASS